MSQPALARASRAITQYLERYSEAEVTSLLGLDIKTRYQHCLVIPAYNELVSAMGYSRPALAANPGTLVVVVVNRPDSDNDTSMSEAFYQAFTQNKEKLFESNSVALFYEPLLEVSFLLIDRFGSQPIPAKQGVGLARKIGCDIGLALYHSGHLTSRWIHTSDCDTLLPADYFTPTQALTNTSAAVYPFRHQALSAGSVAQLAATQHYEAALNYYVERLSDAGSPYAFHTVGSCMAIDCESYARVRGFPKRSAGEDFYLLNKLAKLQPVHSLTHPILTIDSRSSARTPFGTGRAVSAIMALGANEPYCYYNPKSFVALKAVLTQFKQLPAYYGRFQQWLTLLPPLSQDALLHLNINALFKHLEQQVKETHCLSHSHQWFDAFKTLKFIRFLQAYYPDAPLECS